MKYKGRKLVGRNTDVLVLMRGNERIVFKAEALDNYDDFNKMCELPDPPVKLLPGGVKEPNKNDKSYLKRLDDYAKRKTDFCILKSLSINEDVEWEKVDMQKPETWCLWREELKEAGFTEVEMLRILQLCVKVNCLDDDLLEKAREDFLAEALQQEE